MREIGGQRHGQEIGVRKPGIEQFLADDPAPTTLAEQAVQTLAADDEGTEVHLDGADARSDAQIIGPGLIEQAANGGNEKITLAGRWFEQARVSQIGFGAPAGDI